MKNQEKYCKVKGKYNNRNCIYYGSFSEYIVDNGLGGKSKSYILILKCITFNSDWTPYKWLAYDLIDNYKPIRSTNGAKKYIISCMHEHDENIEWVDEPFNDIYNTDNSHFLNPNKPY